ncbi:hypothetical protein BS78_06G286100 [Paspalum vaginatum]|nr:hypothetical protein BS78_06G286100 [Paspalum vaginatum]
MFGPSILGKPLKPSSLSRELCLRGRLTKVMKEYRRLKSIGMLGWPAYKEERDNINRLIQIIRTSIAAYKQRRLEAGLFYFRRYTDRPHKSWIYSHLFYMPLKKALKRRKREMKKRREILAPSYNKDYAHMVVYTIASIILGCIILLIP